MIPLLHVTRRGGLSPS